MTFAKCDTGHNPAWNHLQSLPGLTVVISGVRMEPSQAGEEIKKPGKKRTDKVISRDSNLKEKTKKH